MLINEFQKKALEKEYKVKIQTFEDTTRPLDPHQKITMQFQSLEKEITVEMWAYLREGEKIYEKAEYMVSFKSAYKLLKTKTYDYINKCSLDNEDFSDLYK